MRDFFRSWHAVALLWALLVVVAVGMGFHSLAVAYAVLGAALLLAEWIEIRRTGRTISENTGIELHRRPWKLWLLAASLFAAMGILLAHFWAY